MVDRGLDASVKLLDELLLGHESPAVRMAWRQVKRLALRSKRISETTLPRIASVAQHAIYVRDALDVLIPALPATLYQTAALARDHVVAIITAMSTGATDSNPPPPQE